MFLLAVKSRVIAAAMLVLGMEHIDGKPTENVFEKSSGISNNTHITKEQYIMSLAKLIVDKYVVNNIDAKNMVADVMNEEEQRSLQSIPRLPNGRFPCRFEGCDKSFKYVCQLYIISTMSVKYKHKINCFMSQMSHGSAISVAHSPLKLRVIASPHNFLL